MKFQYALMAFLICTSSFTQVKKYGKISKFKFTQQIISFFL